MIKDIIKNIKNAENSAEDIILNANIKAREMISEAERNAEHLLDLNNALIKQDALKINANANEDAEIEYKKILAKAEEDAKSLYCVVKKEKAVSFIAEEFFKKCQ